VESARTTGDDPNARTTQSALWLGSGELPYRRNGCTHSSAETQTGSRRIAGSLVGKAPQETVYVTWDNAITHQDDEVEMVVRAAAGRLILLYLPTYSPWLNPIEMLWRHFRREVTHCELFLTIKDLITASYEFFNRYNQVPDKTLSLIGAIPK